MIADITRLLSTRPFQPFSVIMSSGSRYRIASPDHADVNPRGSQLVVWFDDDSGVVVSGLHITALELDKPQAAK